MRAGVLDEGRLKAALAEQERWGGRLGSLLVSMGFVSEEILVKALSKQLAVPMAKLDQIDVPANIKARIDLDFAKMNAVCPERYIPERRTLLVAMADPINVSAIDEIVRRTGCRVQPTVAGEREIIRAIGMTYGADAQSLDPGAIEVFQNPRQERSARENGAAQAYVVPIPAPAPTPLKKEPPDADTAPTERPSPPKAALELIASLEAAQKKQLKAIRAMAELLVEKGLISRDEYFARVNRRGS